MRRDYAAEASAAGEAHLELLFDCLDQEGMGIEPDWPAMAAPFCGCLTCIVRETLFVAAEFIIDGTKAGEFE